ncbi:MAG: aminomethyl-transferring glycine dehydrogenase subunit GcvPB [Ignavibacteria bacterium]|jgi:glycine dehydrogenase subunit 2|nr:aminomethyl-transferring glycine dehydrogenase subunit GcvPB [Ignavibacteria bacterium]
MEKLIFEKSVSGRKGYTLPALDVPNKSGLIPSNYLRKTPAALPEVPETDISRHYIRLSNLNHCIEKGFYPLGSCTMKYNPKVNEVVAALPGFAALHPHTPTYAAQGALEVMYELGECLKEITGMQGVTLQPCAGAQGELTGALCFRAYFKHKGEHNRTKMLMPESAHGTNPATAVTAGFTTVTVKCSPNGAIDIDDLKSKLGNDIAGIMITNPSTIGVFESNIIEIEKLIHGCGGLMYMDGANLNALLGITRPGDMHFDCVHINLHKTMSTPHGGGGPGAGPICVNEKLQPFLPTPQIVKNGDKFEFANNTAKQFADSIGRMHSFYGNFGVLLRALTYIRMNGATGMRRIAENAIINANYIQTRLQEHYLLPYKVKCMHECVFSSDLQKENGITAINIAKRLLDYGIHAPTVHFPLIVHEALLIEPTETEKLEDLDDFCNAMIKIAEEAKNTPELVLNAPLTTPVRRLDDALAVRKPNLKYVN